MTLQKFYNRKRFMVNTSWNTLFRRWLLISYFPLDWFLKFCRRNLKKSFQIQLIHPKRFPMTFRYFYLYNKQFLSMSKTTQWESFQVPPYCIHTVLRFEKDFLLCRVGNLCKRHERVGWIIMEFIWFNGPDGDFFAFPFFSSLPWYLQMR